ncbi:hypothetical protein GTA08_BOTSDO03997 [Neofusicoccum parvum]|uniref:Uncharacterized protein n=1 Tax=Neofusicoccum parvum TaxID=310453 RepID=A0ACB5S8W9_9PEZI|nr:hypothetical protein GTA08_BOTSDO03997 [Neofusicoccum parvum]
MRNSPEPSEADYLNSQNPDDAFPTSSDVVVVGGGIHSLIYAIHARLRSVRQSGSDAAASVTVLEKSQSPGYKIGESTLTTFGVWLKAVGISTSVLWRLFGPKDGLAFYYLPYNGDPDGYTDFCGNGPPGTYVATLQIERKISELMLTLHAQRLGVKVLHGHSVDVNSTRLPMQDGCSPGQVEVSNGASNMQINTKLIVDATGRFRRFASKAARVERMPGFNTDAFWAYFEMKGDEADLPFAHYQSCHTNHICMAEGWAWVIRLPSWEGSPLPNLIAMINHLLDLNAANTPSDAYPSSQELARMFNLKFRWVVSIGYALRNDVAYPADLTSYGSCEAERKFNWITSRYPRMAAFMAQHTLIPDLYGPGTTWYIRKQLTYHSPVSAGPGWAAIGDATGFTNPLYSPGINCNLGTSVRLAEHTLDYLAPGATAASRNALLHRYSDFCAARTPRLHMMNTLNYYLMRHPRTGPLGPLWGWLIGIGNPEWQRMRALGSPSVDQVGDFLANWEWGANLPEYAAFAEAAIALLEGPPTGIAGADGERRVEEAVRVSAEMARRAVKGAYGNRWGGVFRYYDDELNWSSDKVARDVLARRCDACRNWRLLTGEAARCTTCGAVNEAVHIVRYGEKAAAAVGAPVAEASAVAAPVAEMRVEETKPVAACS